MGYTTGVKWMLLLLGVLYDHDLGFVVNLNKGAAIAYRKRSLALLAFLSRQGSKNSWLCTSHLIFWSLVFVDTDLLFNNQPAISRSGSSKRYSVDWLSDIEMDQLADDLFAPGQPWTLVVVTGRKSLIDRGTKKLTLGTADQSYE